MKKVEQKAGGLKRKVRNRMRSVTKRVIALGHALRYKGTEGEHKRRGRQAALTESEPTHPMLYLTDVL